jgi:uncharacterized membrane protein (DUF4010 family)
LENIEIVRRLGVALALGLLIGLERGWEQRELAEGQRFAGFRTFGIVSLLGGIAALVIPDSSAYLLGGAFLAVGMICAAGYWRTSAGQEDLSATTAVALLVTFALGALAGSGQLTPAVSAAVVVTVLLGFKIELHSLVERIERPELLATLRLLLISVVMLPILPDRGYGPWHALNPYRIWWMVVLVAGLSYVGYFAIKLMGGRLGVLVTGLFGGLSSSTATAIELAQQGKHNPRLATTLADGVVVASAVMFPRMLVISAVNPSLVPPLAVPLVSAGVVALAIAMLDLRRPAERSGDHRLKLRNQNPLDLSMAIRFGLLLAAIMFLARAAVAVAGTRGIYVLAALSGLADVDAITLSLASMSAHGQATASSAMTGILIAAVVNTLVKPTIVAFTGGVKMGWRVGWPLIVAIAAGGAALTFAGALL